MEIVILVLLYFPIYWGWLLLNDPDSFKQVLRGVQEFLVIALSIPEPRKRDWIKNPPKPGGYLFSREEEDVERTRDNA